MIFECRIQEELDFSKMKTVLQPERPIYFSPMATPRVVNV